ncbi:MarR family transcriptional regulator [Arthrobacter koreensis]|uniref:MarR family transcriptional regulator n=1 Tax=Arthrobacter koreensis TaxID=199136 RepID=A0ABY6FRL6_9MICC|nr:MarR family transcriptional regulator [Arthrobacter koreensis]MEB7446797.1 MarR family transcriptional regulator [Arthrobacter koreensis]UYB35858.1 MarR family transcriptional regulator [Arthrobacter koreensis]
MSSPEHGRTSIGSAGEHRHPTGGGRFESFVDAAVTRAESTLEFEDPMVLKLSLMLRKVNQLMTDDANRQVHQAEGWTQASFRVCFGLWVAGPMPPHLIAATTNMSRASVSAAIKKIEEDGLISREPSPVDQRSTVLRLTDAGEQAVIRTYQSHIALEHHWLEPLNETERLMLFLLLRKLLTGPAASEGRS